MFGKNMFEKLMLGAALVAAGGGLSQAEK